MHNKKILDIFQGFRMPPTPIDQYEVLGKLALDAKMTKFTDNNQPIKFVMLGYPMKSPNNRDKVIGVLPDAAEEASFSNFKRFADEIRKVYSPGVQISIVSDGFMFNDIMQVQDNTVHEYNEMSMDIAKQAPINWFQLTDFYNTGYSLHSVREKVVEQWGITPEILEQRILMDPDVNFLYRGMIKFMTQDLAIRNFPSNTQLQKQAKIVAREMMLRNEAYSKLIATEFTDSIRLSMHPSVNNGTKFSFQLIPSPKAWTSPWHCALLMEKDGQMATIHKKDAEAAGYELVDLNGRPHHYQA
jgi:pyoverdine/dityrosine biosynthesis protein Dit1